MAWLTPMPQQTHDSPILSGPPQSRIYRGKVDASGRVLLPAELRDELHVSEGDAVLFVRNSGTVEIQTLSQAVQRAQDYFCSLAPRNISLVDELLADRRAEAKADDAGSS